MIFQSPKGIIALDIDGTITVQTHTIHSDVVRYLANLHAEGWQFIFITGRPFQWGYQVLQYLPFPYAFAVQNGALILEMPSEKVLERTYLTIQDIPKVEKVCDEESFDFIIYSGWENQDLCYYRPELLDSDLLTYLDRRRKTLGENWVSVKDYKSLPVSEFASFKCFAHEELLAVQLSRKIEKETGLHAPVNRDPFNSNYFVIQITENEANKGIALRWYANLFPKCPIIAAGDDYNDMSMLKEADIRIVMDHAPEELQELADIIPPPTSENGIIQGLSRALNRLKGEGEK